MKATKEAFLANLACQLPPASHEFELNRYTRNATNAARERLVGINNRIVAGMLLYSTRYKLGNCTNNRFSNIEQECITGTHDERSFGVDPVFKVGTELYDNELNYEASQVRTTFAGLLGPGFRFQMMHCSRCATCYMRGAGCSLVDVKRFPR